ncbi:hypothetical protein [Cognaticolwellia mytili]|uniref:hypothetical protein n=1 Tax=Cognaticolwellia mytili TaxID=1888913 RepID=UPI000A17695B|nr:hypothetical protein [Cognaticolwellia mytili]
MVRDYSYGVVPRERQAGSLATTTSPRKNKKFSLEPHLTVKFADVRKLRSNPKELLANNIFTKALYEYLLSDKSLKLFLRLSVS